MGEKEHGGENRTVVRMGEWREGGQGDVLYTQNLGPCIGVAIYEPLSKKGFLLHEPLPEDDGTYARFEDRLRQVFEHQPGSFEGMRVWLSGSSSQLYSAISPGSLPKFADTRRFTEEAMLDLGIPPESVTVSWTPVGYISASMELDCSSGQCHIEFTERPQP
jgi:hypothetical protein